MAHEADRRLKDSISLHADDIPNSPSPARAADEEGPAQGNRVVDLVLPAKPQFMQATRDDRVGAACIDALFLSLVAGAFALLTYPEATAFAYTLLVVIMIFGSTIAPVLCAPFLVNLIAKPTSILFPGANAFFLEGLTPTLLVVFYFAVFESMSGATPGKRILSMVVLNESGKKLTFIESVQRNLFKGLCTATAFVGFLAPFGSKRRPLHDVLSHTIVVYRKQREES